MDLCAMKRQLGEFLTTKYLENTDMSVIMLLGPIFKTTLRARHHYATTKWLEIPDLLILEDN